MAGPQDDDEYGYGNGARGRSGQGSRRGGGRGQRKAPSYNIDADDDCSYGGFNGIVSSSKGAVPSPRAGNGRRPAEEGAAVPPPQAQAARGGARPHRDQAPRPSPAPAPASSDASSAPPPPALAPYSTVDARGPSMGMSMGPGHVQASRGMASSGASPAGPSSVAGRLSASASTAPAPAPAPASGRGTPTKLDLATVLRGMARSVNDLGEREGRSLHRGAAVVLLEGAENAPDNPSFTAPTLPQPHITAVDSSSPAALMIESGCQEVEAVVGPLLISLLQEEVVPEAEAEAASAAARQQSSASTAAYEAVLAAAGIPLPPLSTAACLQVILRVDAIGGRLPITIRKRAEAALKYVNMLADAPETLAASDVVACHTALRGVLQDCGKSVGLTSLRGCASKQWCGFAAGLAPQLQSAVLFFDNCLLPDATESEAQAAAKAAL